MGLIKGGSMINLDGPIRSLEGDRRIKLNKPIILLDEGSKTKLRDPIIFLDKGITINQKVSIRSLEGIEWDWGEPNTLYKLNLTGRASCLGVPSSLFESDRWSILILYCYLRLRGICGYYSISSKHTRWFFKVLEVNAIILFGFWLESALYIVQIETISREKEARLPEIGRKYCITRWRTRNCLKMVDDATNGT